LEAEICNGLPHPSLAATLLLTLPQTCLASAGSYQSLLTSRSLGFASPISAVPPLFAHPSQTVCQCLAPIKSPLRQMLVSSSITTALLLTHPNTVLHGWLLRVDSWMVWALIECDHQCIQHNVPMQHGLALGVFLPSLFFLCLFFLVLFYLGVGGP